MNQKMKYSKLVNHIINQEEWDQEEVVGRGKVARVVDKEVTFSVPGSMGLRLLPPFPPPFPPFPLPPLPPGPIPPDS